MARNYVRYMNGLYPRMALFDFETDTVRPIAYKSGTYVTSLDEIIEAGEDAFKEEEFISPAANIKILPPISGRDILAVGKNYVDHAKEFNQSGFDSSDKTDQPTHPVIFTKRATSIIGHGDEILPHPDFTNSLDYEGEIGVIIGKAGYQITEENAMDHVWGYTIINDVSARERQRDHKQFYIGKSPDTFCPMGPIAVPKEDLPDVLTLQTYVNGEKRQEATSGMLIFSVSVLVKTLSEGITIQPGDVIATGTPVGVGFGFRPMKFLNPGDEVSISVTGLGTLTNRVAPTDKVNPTLAETATKSAIPWSNVRGTTSKDMGLVQVGKKKLFYRRLGVAATPEDNIVFIHGQLSSSEYFTPLLPSLQAAGKALHLIDLEGHGYSPTLATSVTSFETYAEDVAALLALQGVKRTAVVAHCVGSIIAAHLSLQHPHMITKMAFMGPGPLPLPPPIAETFREVASRAREEGAWCMLQIADDVAETYFSRKTRMSNQAAVTAIRFSTMSKDPEGYAKSCTAYATAQDLDWASIPCPTLILTGAEDKHSVPVICKLYAKQIPDCEVRILEDVGHWHLLEDEVRTIHVIGQFISS